MCLSVSVFVCVCVCVELQPCDREGTAALLMTFQLLPRCTCTDCGLWNGSPSRPPLAEKWVFASLHSSSSKHEHARAHAYSYMHTHARILTHAHSRTHAHTLPCLPTLHTVRPPCSDHRRCCESPDGCKVWTGAECHRLPHPNCPSPRQCTRLGRKTWRVVRQRGQIFEMMEQADRAHAHTHARTHAQVYSKRKDYGNVILSIHDMVNVWLLGRKSVVIGECVSSIATTREHTQANKHTKNTQTHKKHTNTQTNTQTLSL